MSQDDITLLTIALIVILGIVAAIAKFRMRRRVQAYFIAHALRSRDEAKRTGNYADADVVVAGLQSKLDDARARLSKPPKTYE